MSTPFVSRSQALRRRAHHQFIPGMGYIAHAGAPDLPAGARGTKNCAPPRATQDGTLHDLQPPSGAPMALIWGAADGAWSHPVPGCGNRLAWEPAHLSAAGWEYIGPSAPAAKKGRKSA